MGRHPQVGRIAAGLSGSDEGTRLHEILDRLLHKLSLLDQYAFFANPVDPVTHGVPDYLEIVKQPMDFSTMKAKLDKGIYTTGRSLEEAWELFAYDFALIGKNSMLYNVSPEHIYHKEAKRLLEAGTARIASAKGRWEAEYAQRLAAPSPSPSLPPDRARAPAAVRGSTDAPVRGRPRGRPPKAKNGGRQETGFLEAALPASSSTGPPAAVYISHAATNAKAKPSTREGLFCNNSLPVPSLTGFLCNSAIPSGHGRHAKAKVTVVAPFALPPRGDLAPVPPLPAEKAVLSRVDQQSFLSIARVYRDAAAKDRTGLRPTEVDLTKGCLLPEDAWSCSICDDGTAIPSNPLLACSNPACAVVVHSQCYGVDRSTMLDNAWFCDPCRVGLHTAFLPCALCSVTGGALKPTDRGVKEHVPLSAIVRAKEALERIAVEPDQAPATISSTSASASIANEQVADVAKTVAGAIRAYVKTGALPVVPGVLTLWEQWVVARQALGLDAFSVLDPRPSAISLSWLPVTKAEYAAFYSACHEVHLPAAKGPAGLESDAAVPREWCHVICSLLCPHTNITSTESIGPITGVAKTPFHLSLLLSSVPVITLADASLPAFLLPPVVSSFSSWISGEEGGSPSQESDAERQRQVKRRLLAAGEFSDLASGRSAGERARAPSQVIVDAAASFGVPASLLASQALEFNPALRCAVCQESGGSIVFCSRQPCSVGVHAQCCRNACWEIASEPIAPSPDPLYRGPLCRPCIHCPQHDDRRPDDISRLPFAERCSLLRASNIAASTAILESSASLTGPDGFPLVPPSEASSDVARWSAKPSAFAKESLPAQTRASLLCARRAERVLLARARRWARDQGDRKSSKRGLDASAFDAEEGILSLLEASTAGEELLHYDSDSAGEDDSGAENPHQVMPDPGEPPLDSVCRGSLSQQQQRKLVELGSQQQHLPEAWDAGAFGIIPLASIEALRLHERPQESIQLLSGLHQAFVPYGYAARESSALASVLNSKSGDSTNTGIIKAGAIAAAIGSGDGFGFQTERDLSRESCSFSLSTLSSKTDRLWDDVQSFYFVKVSVARAERLLGKYLRFRTDGGKAHWRRDVANVKASVEASGSAEDGAILPPSFRRQAAYNSLIWPLPTSLSRSDAIAEDAASRRMIHPASLLGRPSRGATPLGDHDSTETSSLSILDAAILPSASAQLKARQRAIEEREGVSTPHLPPGTAFTATSSTASSGITCGYDPVTGAWFASAEASASLPFEEDAESISAAPTAPADYRCSLQVPAELQRLSVPSALSHLPRYNEAAGPSLLTVQSCLHSSVERSWGKLGLLALSVTSSHSSFPLTIPETRSRRPFAEATIEGVPRPLPEGRPFTCAGGPQQLPVYGDARFVEPFSWLRIAHSVTAQPPLLASHYTDPFLEVDSRILDAIRFRFDTLSAETPGAFPDNSFAHVAERYQVVYPSQKERDPYGVPQLESLLASLGKTVSPEDDNFSSACENGTSSSSGLTASSCPRLARVPRLSPAERSLISQDDPAFIVPAVNSAALLPLQHSGGTFRDAEAENALTFSGWLDGDELLELRQTHLPFFNDRMNAFLQQLAATTQLSAVSFRFATVEDAVPLAFINRVNETFSSAGDFRATISSRNEFTLVACRRLPVVGRVGISKSLSGALLVVVQVPAASATLSIPLPATLQADAAQWLSSGDQTQGRSLCKLLRDHLSPFFLSGLLRAAQQLSSAESAKVAWLPGELTEGGSYHLGEEEHIVSFCSYYFCWFADDKSPGRERKSPARVCYIATLQSVKALSHPELCASDEQMPARTSRDLYPFLLANPSAPPCTGTQLLALSLTHAQSSGMAAALLDSTPEAEKYYLRVAGMTTLPCREGYKYRPMHMSLHLCSFDPLRMALAPASAGDSYLAVCRVRNSLLQNRLSITQPWDQALAAALRDHFSSVAASPDPLPQAKRFKANGESEEASWTLSSAAFDEVLTELEDSQSLLAAVKSENDDRVRSLMAKVAAEEALSGRSSSEAVLALRQSRRACRRAWATFGTFLRRRTEDLKAARKSSEESTDSCCGICGGADSDPRDNIIFCDNCNTAVHQSCYAVPSIPEGEWLCAVCAAGLKPSEVACVLCSIRGGALRPSAPPGLILKADGSLASSDAFQGGVESKKPRQWAHTLCARLCFPSIRVSAPRGAAGNDVFVFGLSEPAAAQGLTWLEERVGKGTCCVCGSSEGITLGCSVKGCHGACHPSCAADAGLLSDGAPEKLFPDDETLNELRLRLIADLFRRWSQGEGCSEADLGRYAREAVSTIRNIRFLASLRLPPSPSSLGEALLAPVTVTPGPIVSAEEASDLSNDEGADRLMKALMVDLKKALDVFIAPAYDKDDALRKLLSSLAPFDLPSPDLFVPSTCPSRTRRLWCFCASHRLSVPCRLQEAAQPLSQRLAAEVKRRKVALERLALAEEASSTQSLARSLFPSARIEPLAGITDSERFCYAALSMATATLAFSPALTVHGDLIKPSRDTAAVDSILPVNGSAVPAHPVAPESSSRSTSAELDSFLAAADREGAENASAIEEEPSSASRALVSSASGSSSTETLSPLDFMLIRSKTASTDGAPVTWPSEVFDCDDVKAMPSGSAVGNTSFVLSSVLCAVCADPEVARSSDLLSCASCKICVHPLCYGESAELKEGEPWLCGPCSFKLPSPLVPCCLCCARGGALRPTIAGLEAAAALTELLLESAVGRRKFAIDAIASAVAAAASGVPVFEKDAPAGTFPFISPPLEWAHASCGGWVPEVTSELETSGRLSFNTGGIPTARRKLKCKLCACKVGAGGAFPSPATMQLAESVTCDVANERAIFAVLLPLAGAGSATGAPIQCVEKSCVASYHVSCGFQNGYPFNFEPSSSPSGGEGSLVRTAFCPRHNKTSRFAKANTARPPLSFWYSLSPAALASAAREALRAETPSFVLPLLRPSSFSALKSQLLEKGLPEEVTVSALQNARAVAVAVLVKGLLPSGKLGDGSLVSFNGLAVEHRRQANRLATLENDGTLVVLSSDRPSLVSPDPGDASAKGRQSCTTSESSKTTSSAAKKSEGKERGLGSDLESELLALIAPAFEAQKKMRYPPALLITSDPSSPSFRPLARVLVSLYGCRVNVKALNTSGQVAKAMILPKQERLVSGVVPLSREVRQAWWELTKAHSLDTLCRGLDKRPASKPFFPSLQVKAAVGMGLGICMALPAARDRSAAGVGSPGGAVPQSDEAETLPHWDFEGVELEESEENFESSRRKKSKNQTEEAAEPQDNRRLLLGCTAFYHTSQSALFGKEAVASAAARGLNVNQPGSKPHSLGGDASTGSLSGYRQVLADAGAAALTTFGTGVIVQGSGKTAAVSSDGHILRLSSPLSLQVSATSQLQRSLMWGNLPSLLDGTKSVGLFPAAAAAAAGLPTGQENFSLLLSSKAAATLSVTERDEHGNLIQRVVAVDDCERYCVCRKTYAEDSSTMVSCASCKEWFHLHCLDLRICPKHTPGYDPELEHEVELTCLLAGAGASHINVKFDYVCPKCSGTSHGTAANA